MKRNRQLLAIVAAGMLMGSSTLFAKNEKGTLNTNTVLTHAETIKSISQDFAKNYFYVQQGIQVAPAKKGLKKNMLALDDSIRSLQLAADKDSGNAVVEFMFFSIDELKMTLKESFSAENGGLVLDYTETLLEGSENIIAANKTSTATMLNVVEEMEFLIERASKYYIAFRAGYTDEVNIQQAKYAVKKFEILLKKVMAHKYPESIKKGPIKKLAKYWPVSKNFYLGIKKSDLPTIVFISTKHMKSALDKLVEYHK